MTSVSPDHLAALYAETDDPWSFRESEYEQGKFRATAAALPRARYRTALEIGCGNGELARHLASRCDAYMGLDAVDVALEAARRAVPEATFRRIFLPAPLPEGDYDLIVLSEILYFLDPEGLEDLAFRIGGIGANADLVCVTWLGPTGNPLQGEEALSHFVTATGRHFERARGAAGYRVDVSGGQL